jgi:hypothetical protein
MTTGQWDMEEMRRGIDQASQDRRTMGQMGAASPFGYSHPNPQAMYGQMGQPDMRRQQVAQQLQQQIMGQTPTTAAGGFAKLATGIGIGLNDYRQQGQQFPTAPGGAAPSFATTLGNFFTGRSNGGLY